MPPRPPALASVTSVSTGFSLLHTSHTSLLLFLGYPRFFLIRNDIYCFLLKQGTLMRNKCAKRTFLCFLTYPNRPGLLIPNLPHSVQGKAVHLLPGNQATLVLALITRVYEKHQNPTVNRLPVPRHTGPVHLDRQTEVSLKSTAPCAGQDQRYPGSQVGAAGQGSKKTPAPGQLAENMQPPVRG